MRILCIDYGQKRCGIAVSDPLRLIATGLTTVPKHELLDWLADYLATEEVGDLVVGESLQADGTPNPVMQEALGFVRKFRKLYPDIVVHRQDEALSSRRARSAMLAMGMKKQQRRDKSEVDRIAAALILQDFMEGRG